MITALQESRENDLSNLSLEAKDCRDRAKQFREELCRNLERMEAKTISDINVFKTQETKTITQQIDTCKAAQNSLDTHSRKLQLAKEQHDRQGIFVYNIQLAQAVKSLTTITEEITKELYQPHIYLECNQAINIAADHDLGTVKCHTPGTAKCQTPGMVKCQTPRIPQQKGFDKVSGTAHNTINIKLQSDTYESFISGSTFLTSGELVLCNHNNNKLKLLDKSLQMKESIDVPGSPLDVAPVNQHQVIVTFPLKNTYSSFK